LTGRQVQPVAAVLFDLDGVLVDSEAAIDWSMTTWSLERGLDPRLVLEAARGRRDIDVVPGFLAGADPAPELARISELDTVALPLVRAVPGAAELLSVLPRRSWAVVTSGGAEIARARLQAAGLPLPSVLIAAEHVGAGKPDPECYLRAAAALGARPGDCVAFEDAEAGLRAARRAGTRVVRVGDGGAASPEWDGHESVTDLTQVAVTVTDAHTIHLRPLGNPEAWLAAPAAAGAGTPSARPGSPWS
jgi:mannitol-1-/sugar-/sorbitol-6-phosphatase